MRRHLRELLALGLVLFATPGAALVNYDKGRELVLGVQLLQDSTDPNTYYYLPQFPRLATKADGTFDLLCMKFVDPAGAASGGLFHALVEFTLPPDVVTKVESELKQRYPQARIAGPVPLMPVVDKGEEGIGGFRIVSSVLSDIGERKFTRSVVTSGSAPLTPGSKAVVAALLNPAGATLLWDTFKGPTSDVSIAIRAYYEAAVEAYNAKVTADVNVLYDHFSRVRNRAEGYTRNEILKITDDLRREQKLKVEVFDRTQGLSIKDEFMPAILQLVTDKLTELMFDHQTGWAVDPQRENGVEAGQIQGRQERGFFSRIFGGAEDTKYFTDNQYVLKQREDIRQASFSLVLSRSTSIRVPVDTAGNLGGLFTVFGNDDRYFRISTLDDPTYEARAILFQLDGSYLDAFQDTINFVSIILRKLYPTQPAATETVTVTYEDVKKGVWLKELKFNRMGMPGSDWLDYDYQIRWNLRGAQTSIPVPPDPNGWIHSRDPAVSLAPPFGKRVIDVEVDNTAFIDRKVTTASVVFHSIVGGQKVRHVETFKSDAPALVPVGVYHDEKEPDVAVQIFWHFATGSPVEQRLGLPGADDHLLLTPPAPPPAPHGPDGGAR